MAHKHMYMYVEHLMKSDIWKNPYSDTETLTYTYPSHPTFVSFKCQ